MNSPEIKLNDNATDNIGMKTCLSGLFLNLTRSTFKHFSAIKYCTCK